MGVQKAVGPTIRVDPQTAWEWSRPRDLRKNDALLHHHLHLDHVAPKTAQIKKEVPTNSPRCLAAGQRLIPIWTDFLQLREFQFSMWEITMWFLSFSWKRKKMYLERDSLAAWTRPKYQKPWLESDLNVFSRLLSWSKPYPTQRVN